MANKYSYSFAPKASRDLIETLKYIEEELSNPKASEDLAIKIFDKIDIVREFPESGAKVNNEFISDQSLRRLVVDNYVVYYKAEDVKKSITIVRIIYGKRNVDEILKTL